VRPRNWRSPISRAPVGRAPVDCNPMADRMGSDSVAVRMDMQPRPMGAMREDLGWAGGVATTIAGN
jgi:hypothetical protein